MTAKELTPKLEEITPDTLAERAILVAFHRKAWSPTARDADLERDTKDRHQYNGDATIRKVLIDKTFLAEWNANARAAKVFHKSMTLPWTDRGFRVLLAQNIEKYTNGMAEFQATSERLAVELQGRWPTIIEHSKTLWPDALYDETNYPTTDEILGLFQIGWDERPVPTAGDFRLANVNDAMRSRMQENLEKAVAASIEQAMAEPWLRLTEAVQRMLGTLTEGGRFEYTMLTHLASVASAIPGLNLTNDPALAEISDDINALLKDLAEKAEVELDEDEEEPEKKVAQETAKKLRKDEELAQSATDQAQAVLDKMAGFMGGAA
jgi:hypothetical protein